MTTRKVLHAVGVATLLLAMAGVATAQAPASCTATGVPVLVRAEGLTELVSDLVLECTGGLPTPNGVAVPPTTITLFLNTNVTSRLLAAPWTEALLLVDEPAPGVQLACQTANGVCSINGTGSGVGTYDGTAGRFNVFQGQLATANSIVFSGVPFDPPGIGNTRTLRITNIRVDASAIDPITNGIPGQIIGFISLPGVSVNNPQQSLAFVQTGLRFAIRDAAGMTPLSGPVELPQCSSVTNMRIATLRFSEGFGTAFKKRNAATSLDSPSALEDQNIVGSVPTTETAFFDTGLVGNSARGDLGGAGLADFGTRLKAAFADVPPGVTVFVATDGTEGLGDSARLTATETGSFAAVSGGTGGAPAGAAMVSVSNGTGSVVWEVLETDPVTSEGLEFGVYVNYTSIPADGMPALGTATVAGSLAPISSEVTAATGPVPRFADSSTPTSVFSITPCTGGAPTHLVAAVLPGSRSVQVGTAATAFATIINAGPVLATACSIAPLTSVPATFLYQTTNPATNEPMGTVNTPVDVAAGSAQTFVFALTPTTTIDPTDVQLAFECLNTDPAPVTPGLNTLLLSASDTPIPDIVALPATIGNDGIVHIPGTSGTGVFAVAAANVGAAAPITVSADTGNVTLPVTIGVCETDLASGTCLSAIAPSVITQIDSGETPAFGIFVTGTGTVPFDPGANRVFVRFTDEGGIVRGSTSVAVQTQ
jgi:hypothetical protein